jgi:molybdopterin/thiamine biosynthesis adenylyltransferase
MTKYQQLHQNIRPKLQPTIIAVPLSSQRLGIHRGTRQADGYLILEDPGGWRFSAIRLMDGTRTIEEIIHALGNGSESIALGDLNNLVTDLQVAGVVSDVSAFAPGGLSAEKVERYSRNLNGWAALSIDERTAAQLQTQLGRGHVLMLGAGGLGSTASLALAMAGCGILTLLDFDTVELSNLNRQLYTPKDLGKPKVDALKKKLEKVNSELVVTAINQKIKGAAELREIICKVNPDIVIGAIDRPVIANDRWVSEVCVEFRKPFILNSVSAGTGMVWAKVPGVTGCFSCDEMWAKTKVPDHYEIRRYREANDLIPATSAFSYGAMAVGAMIAAEATRCLVKWPMASAGRLIALDFTTLTTTVTEKPAHPDCPVCQQQATGAHL